MSRPIVQYRVVCRLKNWECRVIGVTEIPRRGKRVSRCYVESCVVVGSGRRKESVAHANVLNALNDLPPFEP